MRPGRSMALVLLVAGCGARETYIPVAPNPADFGVPVDTGPGSTTPTTPTGTPTGTVPTGTGSTTTVTLGFPVAGNALDGWTAQGVAGELCVDGVCSDVDGPFATTSEAVGEFVMTLTGTGYEPTHSVRVEGANGDYSMFVTPTVDVDNVYATAGVVRDPTKSTIVIRHAGLSGSALPTPPNGQLVYTGIAFDADGSLTALGRGHGYVLNADAVGLTQFDFTPCIPTYNQSEPSVGLFSVNLVAGEVAVVTATCY